MKKVMIPLFLFVVFSVIAQEATYQSKYFDEFIEWTVIRDKSVKWFDNSCELVIEFENTGDKAFYLGNIIVYAVSLENELTIGKAIICVEKTIFPEKVLKFSHFIPEFEFEYYGSAKFKRFLWYPDYETCEIIEIEGGF